MENSKQKGNMPILIICAVLFLVLWFIQNAITKQGNPELQALVANMKDFAGANDLHIDQFIGPLEGMSHQPQNTWNGVIAQFQVMLSVILVITNYKNGLISAISLNAFACIMALRTVIIRGNVNAIPGVAVPIFTVIIIYIIYNNIVKISKMHDDITASYEQAIENNRIIQEKDEVLSYLAYYDRLTQLPNRQLFMDNLESRVKDGEEFTVIYVDIDNFRYINDQYGHSTGDELLIQYSERLGEYCGEDNFVAKIGGDEFGIILPDVADNQKIATFYQGIQNVFGNPIKLRGELFRVTVSCGVASFPNDARSSEDVFRCAETGMFNAKAGGKNQVSFFVRRG